MHESSLLPDSLPSLQDSSTSSLFSSQAALLTLPFLSSPILHHEVVIRAPHSTALRTKKKQGFRQPPGLNLLKSTPLIRSSPQFLNMDGMGDVWDLGGYGDKALQPGTDIEPDTGGQLDKDVMDDSDDGDGPDDLDEVRHISYTAGLRTKAFQSEKVRLAKKFLRELDDEITGGELSRMTSSSGGIKIVWNKRYSKKAGNASTKITRGVVTYSATISLSEKFLTNRTRLLNTLAHEFCHVADNFISNKHGHGTSFESWGRKCTQAFGHRGIGRIETYHKYDMEFDYIWTCTNDDCGKEFGRHSKSIDPDKVLCDDCGGAIVQTNPIARALRNRRDWKGGNL
ncbi:hypothetical protein D6D24_06451 [Aureobasidium pullulans]|uniref:SprT-like domain-containing protein n=1 Tax=Aureobasidium pullulans TaxID=5580 RepID=A0A4S8VLN1_AURPU|nr:hypothetical protein D6D24_06451 [Aureobasidium pullulans]